MKDGFYIDPEDQDNYKKTSSWLILQNINTGNKVFVINNHFSLLP